MPYLHMPGLAKQFIILSLLTLAGSAYSLINGIAPLPWAAPAIEAGEIRPEDARALEVIWVDARSAAEFEESHISGALLYDPADPAGSMAGVLEAWLQQPRVIVVYCSDASCGTSKQVAETLRANLPDAEIYSLKGGWQAWSD